MQATARDDFHRQLVLESYSVVDTPPEQDWDELALLAARAASMPFAWVSFLDDHHEWIKSSKGIEPGAVPIALSLAAPVVRSDGVVLCPDTALDLRYARHPWVTGTPKLRFLALVPIHGDQGLPVGVLALADTAPRPVDELIDVLPSLARQAESLLELRRLRMQRDVLSSHVVHDLKNPLAALSLNAEFCLRETPQTSSVWETLRDITQITQVVDRLVRDIGDVTREGRTINVRPHPVDCAELCLKLRQKSQRALDRVGARLEIDVDPALGQIELDERLMERVFLNLMDFAITRTPAKRSILLSLRAVGEEIEARITDEGAPVEPENLQRLFHPRLGVAGDTLANISGRRFGFAFCRMAIEAHRGRIWAEETATQGVTCCLRIPLHRPAEIVPLATAGVSRPWFEQLGRLTPWAGLTPQPRWHPTTPVGS